MAKMAKMATMASMTSRMHDATRTEAAGRSTWTSVHLARRPSRPRCIVARPALLAATLLWLAVLLAVLVIGLRSPPTPLARVDAEERVDAVTALLRRRRIESSRAMMRRGAATAAAQQLPAVTAATRGAAAAAGLSHAKQTASPFTGDSDLLFGEGQSVAARKSVELAIKEQQAQIAELTARLAAVESA